MLTVIETHSAYATGGGTEGQVKFLRARPLELISSINAASKGIMEVACLCGKTKNHMPYEYSAVLKNSNMQKTQMQ